MSIEEHPENTDTKPEVKTRGDTESESTELGKFDIEDFLRENYKLFTILSAFGAISVYLPQIGNIESNLLLRIGFISVIFLTLLTVFTVNRRFFLEVGKSVGLGKAFLHPRSDTYEIVLFFTPFNALAISLIAVSGAYTATLAYLFQFIGLGLGVVITFHAIRIRDEFADNEKMDTGSAILNLAIAVLVCVFLGLVLVIVAVLGVGLIEHLGGISQDTLFVFTPQLGILAVLASVFFGVGLAGIIYWCIALILTLDGIIQVLTKLYTLAISEVHHRI